MDWYYSNAGNQVGPVADGPFSELVRSGQVTDETLVWREGMPTWQVYRNVRQSPGIAPAPVLAPPPPPPGTLRVAGATGPAGAAVPGAPPVALTATCAECGYLFPQSEMVAYEKSWICAKCKPVFFQRVLEGVPMAAGAAQAWRSGDAVVLPVGGDFPGRCIRCNGQPQGKLHRRTLYWHQQWVYILLLSPVIYVLVSLLIRKTAKVAVPICDRDRSEWLKWVLISWGMVLVGLAGLIVAAGISNSSLALVAVIVFFAGLLMGPLKATLVKAKKIDSDFVWITGTGRPFRDALPEFPGQL